MSSGTNVRTPSVPARCVRGSRFDHRRSRLVGIRLLARPALAIVALAAWLAWLPDTSWAQTKTFSSETVPCGQGKPVTDKSCQKEFDDWQAREQRWREHRQIWANYAWYNGFRVTPAKRAAPPGWIAPYCQPQSGISVKVSADPVCLAYDDYLRYDWLQHIEGPQAATNYFQRVSVGGSGDSRGFLDYLLKHVHYDGGWTNSQAGPRVYGVFGTHLTMATVGRFYVWGPPGVLLVKRPEGPMEVRMTWGIDFLIADIPMPFGQGRKVPLYLSVVKAFDKNEQQALEKRINAGMDMIGFSVSIKR